MPPFLKNAILLEISGADIERIIMGKLTRFAAVSLSLMVTLAVVDWAEAKTCNSVCNQWSRACGAEGKAVRKAAQIECRQVEEQCKSDCAANEATCIPDCADTYDICAGACAASCAGDQDPSACEVACESGCSAGQAQCNDDCVNCVEICDESEVICKSDAIVTFKTTKETCRAGAGTCKDSCESIDGACVTGCRNDLRSCARAAKLDANQCKKTTCKNAENRRTCVKECLRSFNSDLQACSNSEAVCYGGCVEPPLSE